VGVLDVSALVDVVVDQPAEEFVLGHLDQPILAPAHQLGEVLSALARLVRADMITLRMGRALHWTRLLPSSRSTSSFAHGMCVGTRLTGSDPSSRRSLRCARRGA